MSKIPLVDLKRQYNKYKEEIDLAISNVINDSAFISKKYTEIFEKQFAQYCGVENCVATGSGTDGLITAYFAAGVSNGDEVITIANTFTATAETMTFLGAKPIFVDIDPETQLIDPSLIENKINEKTKAIVPVHLFGNPAQMEEIVKIAKKHNLKVIEDCAHAHGATINGKMVGTFGDIGVYSFNPAKVLGAFGDAGCIVTNNKDMAEKAREFINHGRKTNNKYLYDSFGMNLRMDGIQASILSAKLRHLDDWVSARRRIANRYIEELSGLVEIPKINQDCLNSYHLFVIMTEKRDDLIEYLKNHDIEAGIHYPVPLNLQEPYIKLVGVKQNLPITENISKRILSLPIFPEMTDEEILLVTRTIKEFLSANK